MNEQEIRSLKQEIVGTEKMISESPLNKILRDNLIALRLELRNLILQNYNATYTAKYERKTELLSKNLLNVDEGNELRVLQNELLKLLDVIQSTENASISELTTRELATQFSKNNGISNSWTITRQSALPPPKNSISFVESEKSAGCTPFGNIFSPEFNDANNGYALLDLRLVRKVITDIVDSVSENIGETFASSGMRQPIRESGLTSLNIPSVSISWQSTGVVRELYTATGLDTSTTERDYQQQIAIQIATLLRKAKTTAKQRSNVARNKAKKIQNNN